MRITDQATYRSSLIWFYTVCQRGFKSISADSKSRRLVVIGTLRVNKCEFSIHYTCKCIHLPEVVDIGVNTI